MLLRKVTNNTDQRWVSKIQEPIGKTSIWYKCVEVCSMAFEVWDMESHGQLADQFQWSLPLIC